MTHSTFETFEIYLLIQKIKEYEPAIFEYIKSFLRYRFSSNQEIREAIDLYMYSNQPELAWKKYGPIFLWDTSQITNMDYLFSPRFHKPTQVRGTSMVKMNRFLAEKAYQKFNMVDFNENLNDWDTSQVTSMKSLFSGFSNFNQQLDKWDVSQVTDMRNMFAHCTKLNQNLNS